MNGIIQVAFNKFVNILFPYSCIVCREILEDNEDKICDACILQIREIPSFCLKCGTPLNLMQDWCRTCRYKKIYYERLFSLFIYDGTIEFLIKKIKYDPYNSSPAYFEMFYNLMNSNYLILDELSMLSSDLDLLIPVPIHNLRYEQRGYNQSVFFANILSEILNLPVLDDMIIKNKNTKFFYSLLKKERELELENAFEIINNKNILGKNILLIDDISTTGVTFNALSKLLLINGANSVFCVCIAHKHVNN